MPLTFPDAPRLELDQLLEQLVDRAREVLGTQGRLRGLLRASRTVTEDLALPVVLRRIAEAAKDLIGARYAALGVVGSDGHLAEFVHTGMPDDVVARIGRLPEGKGLLGVLLEDPRPLRLGRIADDLRSSGFPDDHPPMSSFLGIPIWVRGVPFGNLYLTESERGQFSAEDEELAGALAATAGSAIDNARLYQAAHARQRWLSASNDVTRQLLSADPDSPLRLIGEHVRDVADADLVTVLRPTETGAELRIEVAVGIGAEQLTGRRVAVAGSVSGRVLSTGEPVLGPWRESHITDPVVATLDIDEVMAVPLLGSSRVNGVLTAARVTGRPRFTSAELDMAAAFANQASVSIELAEARAEQHRNAIYDERDRIAEQLRTHAIQRLSGAAMALQTTMAGAHDELTAARIRTTVDELDEVVRQIRTSVFQLENATVATHPLRHRLLDELNRAAPLLGFAPSLELTGQIDLDGAFADAVVGTVRLALASIIRAGPASSVDIVIARTDRLTVGITFDGAFDADGVDQVALAAQAEHLGGTYRITEPAPGTSRLTWSVPGPP